MDNEAMIAAVARAIEPELSKQEMLLADPLTLRRLMAERVARAAINAAAPFFQQWQPIVTAPEDGDMLVCNGDVVAVAFRDSGMSSYRFFSPATQSDLAFQPTHWIPLPPPPALEERFCRD